MRLWFDSKDRRERAGDGWLTRLAGRAAERRTTDQVAKEDVVAAKRRRRCLEMAIRLFESSQDEDDSARLAHVLAAARAFEAYLRGDAPRDGKPELLRFPGANDRS